MTYVFNAVAVVAILISASGSFSAAMAVGEDQVNNVPPPKLREFSGGRRLSMMRSPRKNEDENEKKGGGDGELFLGIFMQPPAYENSNCATFRKEFEARNELRQRDVDGSSFFRSREEVFNMEVENSDTYHSSFEKSKREFGVTLPPDSNATCCVSSYYTRWAEQAGMRVIPIPTFSSDADLSWYLDRVNGVLFTGGIILDDSEVMRHYVNRATFIYNYAMAKHKGTGPTTNGLPAKEHFPLWGTCQGFEILHIVAAGGYPAYFKILQTNLTGMRPKMLPVTFYEEAREKSTMFSAVPKNLLDAMENKDTTLNFHVKGIPPTVYDPQSSNYYPQVAEVFAPLAISWDTSKQPFVAAVEGRNGLPIFAVQFHPEKPAYDFSNPAVAHDLDTLGIATYFAFFLAEQLKKNNHKFASSAEANRLTINQYPLVNIGYGLQYYFV